MTRGNGRGTDAPPQHGSTSLNDGHKKSQGVGDADGSVFQPRHVHFRLAAAYEAALQDGLNPTDGVIAKKLNVARETIVRWRRRNPAMRRWLYEQLGQEAAALRPLVDRRVTHLALSGSPEHTKLFYQFVAKVAPGYDEPAAASAGLILNLLVPRPDLPGLPAPNPVPTRTIVDVPVRR